MNSDKADNSTPPPSPFEFEKVPRGIVDRAMQKMRDDIDERMLRDFSISSAVVDLASTRGIFSKSKALFDKIIFEVNRTRRVTRSQINALIGMGLSVEVVSPMEEHTKIVISLGTYGTRRIDVWEAAVDGIVEDDAFIKIDDLLEATVMRPPYSFSYVGWNEDTQRQHDPRKPMTAEEKQAYFKLLRKKAGLKE